MKFTKIPTNTFKELQLNAGVLVSEFTPSSGTVTASNIIGATSGGVNFTATPEYTDSRDDIHNCPKNIKELKRLDNWTVEMSGTYLTVNTTVAKALVGAADIDGSDNTKIVPRNDIADTDFSDIWWVGDYITRGGVFLPCDGGAIWVKKGVPFSQTMSDDNDKMIKRNYLNLELEFLTEN